PQPGVGRVGAPEAVHAAEVGQAAVDPHAGAGPDQQRVGPGDRLGGPPDQLLGRSVHVPPPWDGTGAVRATPLLPAETVWFISNQTVSAYRNCQGMRPLTRVRSVPSTVAVEGAEHIVIAGGGDVGEDERVGDPHVAVLEREPAAHAPAVEAAAAA